MLKNLFRTLAVILFTSQISLSQHNIVAVNPSTGTANVGIPLYTVIAGKLSLPVSISYTATGIKANDVESLAGVGWQLNAGGVITRQVRGLPDDCTRDITGNNRYGWLHTSINFASFSIANDNDPSTCADETTDLANIADTYPSFYDTEPDIFNVNAPGLSCQLVFDNLSGTFKAIPYQDLKISYLTNTTSGSTYGEITSFTITNDQGITYTFAAPDAAWQKTTGPISGGVTYFKKTYDQYQYGINYSNAWSLTSISDSYNNSITLSYNAGTTKGYSNPVEVVLTGSSVSTPTLTEYTTIGHSVPNLLSQISYSDGNGSPVAALTFAYMNTPLTHKDVIIAISGYGRSVTFNYSDVYCSGGSSFQRYFLRNVGDADCGSPIKYSFSYNNEAYSAGNYYTNLPDSSGTSVDYWGYFNGVYNATLNPAININPSTNPLTSGHDRYRIGQSFSSLSSIYQYSIAGADRHADYYSSAGSLSTITYVNSGATTTLSYEPNDYYDPDAGANITGAGIRILNITDYDGINTANNVTKHYSYYAGGGASDDLQNSNGKPISLPIYSFTTPYNGSYTTTEDLWDHSTIISTSDLSQEDHTILYSFVTESQTGKGKTIYSYNIPATNWDTGGISGGPSWSPTIVNNGRSSVSGTCPAIGFLVNDKNTYPFPQNPNYDFERALISSVKNYNESGTIVSETNYTYNQNNSTPSVITAFKFDVNNYGMGYAKYTINTMFNPVPSLVQTKIYDLGSGTVNKTSNTSYSYNSNYKVSQQSITNSDNTILTTNIQYAKDYNALTHNDSYTTGLYNLQLQNINIPIETYSQVTIGGTTKTTGGSLVLFNSTPGFGGSTNLTLPIRKLSFTDPYGFTGFTTSGISGGYFVNDSHYITNENNLIYDYSGFLLSKDDGFGHQQAAIIDHNSYQPVAVMKNATYDQIAFSDFDSKLSGFTFSGGGSSSTTSRTGALGWSLNSGASLSRLGITNNTKAQNYIFSIWIYGSGSGNVSITDGASTNSASISASGSGWTYHEVHIPVANLSSSLNVSFSATSNSIIDDILCYPDIAEVSTFAYDNTTHFKTAETNTNGVSTYYINDTWGRKLYIYDQDHNIIQRNSYVTISQNFTPTIALSYPQYFNTAISFSIAGYGSCVGSGVTVDWSIDGASMITAAALSYALSHTFTSGSSHTATAIVHIPGVGDKTVTSTFTISTNPNPTVAVTYNTYTFGNGNVSSITFTPTGGGTAITKSNAQLIAGFSIPQGSYSVNVTLSGGTYYNSGTGLGYRSIALNGDCNSTGANHSSTNNYTLSLDLSTCATLNVVVSQYGYGD